MNDDSNNSSNGNENLNVNNMNNINTMSIISQLVDSSVNDYSNENKDLK